MLFTVLSLAKLDEPCLLNVVFSPIQQTNSVFSKLEQQVCHFFILFIGRIQFIRGHWKVQSCNVSVLWLSGSQEYSSLEWNVLFLCSPFFCSYCKRLSLSMNKDLQIKDYIDLPVHACRYVSSPRVYFIFICRCYSNFSLPPFYELSFLPNVITKKNRLILTWSIMRGRANIVLC